MISGCSSPATSPAVTTPTPSPVATPTTTPTTTPTATPTPTPVPVLTISSSAFNDGDFIPVKYSGDGVDVSPALSWTGAPAGTKSFALLVTDPDAPGGEWTHWVIYNIPATAMMLNEDVPGDKTLADGSIQGVNDFGSIGYGGPSPPPGNAHRYFFRLYALDTTLSLPERATKAQVLNAITGHILAQAELMGKYQS